MDENRKTLQQWVDESSNIVFFGGAGMSTESGVPDFRSKDGLYNQCYDEPPETIISHSYFVSYPDKFYRFYRDKMMPLSAEPNVGHLKLAELEAAGKLRAVLTQNIDGLHPRQHLSELLHEVRQVLAGAGDRRQQGHSLVRLRRYDQAGRGAV